MIYIKIWVYLGAGIALFDEVAELISDIGKKPALEKPPLKSRVSNLGLWLLSGLAHVLLSAFLWPIMQGMRIVKIWARRHT